MLLPQSSAFALLKNRLNSVSAIGYLHVSPRATAATSSTAGYERPNRLKGGREDGPAGVRWGELLEKFRGVQEKGRRSHMTQQRGADGLGYLGVPDKLGRPITPTLALPGTRLPVTSSHAVPAVPTGAGSRQQQEGDGKGHQRSKSGLPGNLGRLGGVAVGTRKVKK
jgi:vacuole morphology and inheritance protein 14